jgi:hypothetical protein
MVSGSWPVDRAEPKSGCFNTGNGPTEALKTFQGMWEMWCVWVWGYWRREVRGESMSRHIPNKLGILRGLGRDLGLFPKAVGNFR